MPDDPPYPASTRPLAETVLDALDEGIIVVRPGGAIGYANRRAEALFGYSPGELTGISVEQLVPDGVWADHEQDRTTFGAASSVRGAHGRRRDGTEFPVAVVLRPFTDGAALAVVRDWAAVQARPREAESALGMAVVGALEERVAVVDGAGTIIATSRSWDDFARSAGAATHGCGVGTNYLDVCRRAIGSGSEEAAEVVTGLTAVLRGNAGRFATEYMCPVGGVVRWYRVLIKPLAGEPTRAVVVHSDVTDRRSAERERDQSEVALRAVIEAQTELIRRVRPDGTLTFVNGAYCRFFGRDQRELLGHRFWEQVLAPDRELVTRHLAAIAPDRPVGTVEYRVLGPDGALRWLEWTDRGFFDEAGRVVGFQSVGRDVTARKQAEDALRASEARFRDLFRNAPLATACWRAAGADFILADCNEAARRLTAGGIARMIGRRLSELHPDHPDHRANVARCYRERSTFDCETHWTNVGWAGPASDVLVSYSFVPPNLVMSAVQLITARKEQERALRESAERMRLILSALHEGVLLLDTDGRTLLANESAARLLGCPAARLLGGLPSAALGPVRDADARPVPAEQLPWELARATGGACVGVALVVEQEGRTVRLVVNAHALPDPGPPYPVVVSLTDTTAQWRAEEQLHQQQAELAHFARYVAVGEMAAVLAHELNQPLTAVINYCRGSALRLRNGVGTAAEAAEGLDLAAAQAERAAGIIRRLREFMRKRPPHRSTTDINDTVREALALVGPELRHHQIEVALGLDPELPPVRVDRVQIEQVLLNLLRNAAEALVGVPAGRRIAIGTRRAAEGVVVEVADTGAGLRPDELERVFEPFYTTKEQGTGLGLTISRSIIEAHGGRLTARAGAECGAVFEFTLPLEAG